MLSSNHSISALREFAQNCLKLTNAFCGALVDLPSANQESQSRRSAEINVETVWKQLAEGTSRLMAQCSFIDGVIFGIKESTSDGKSCHPRGSSWMARQPPWQTRNSSGCGWQSYAEIPLVQQHPRPVMYVRPMCPPFAFQFPPPPPPTYPPPAFSSIQGHHNPSVQSPHMHN